ncbi:MAG: dihydroneopterin aldolase [Candidatus Aceula meridiana]|nr:dihydroneopterin aldolase [Candidatus Aceula meridiana]
MAKIHIKNLQLSVIIGTTPKEREDRQTVYLDLSFKYDSQKAEENDNLSDAVDYEALAAEVVAKAQNTKFFLIEKLASFILNLVLIDKRIKRTKVIIYKPKAVSKTDSVSIELSRDH